jgi:hypothetical protein
VSSFPPLHPRRVPACLPVLVPQRASSIAARHIRCLRRLVAHVVGLPNKRCVWLGSRRRDVNLRRLDRRLARGRLEVARISRQRDLVVLQPRAWASHPRSSSVTAPLREIVRVTLGVRAGDEIVVLVHTVAGVCVGCRNAPGRLDLSDLLLRRRQRCKRVAVVTVNWAPGGQISTCQNRWVVEFRISYLMNSEP